MNPKESKISTITSDKVPGAYTNILFVADFPKETTAEDLEAFFKDYSFSTATINSNNPNNIWAQVFFENSESANQARLELNGEILTPKKLSKGKPVRICRFEPKSGYKNSQNLKQSLLVKNIDPSMTQKEFFQLFLKFGDISSAKIEYDDKGDSKGFGYIYYFSEESAEDAKKNLNGKIHHGKALEIVNLIPLKTTKQKPAHNTLFVLNIPYYFDDNEFKKLFEGYGEILSVSNTKRGYGYVCLANEELARICMNDLNSKQINFDGLPPIVVKLATPKDERENIKKQFMASKPEVFPKLTLTLFAQNENLKNDDDLEKEIRLFLKVIMLSDYNPKEVAVNPGTQKGTVTFNNLQEYNTFMKKYGTFCLTNRPIFACDFDGPDPYQHFEGMYDANYYEQFNSNIFPNSQMNNNVFYSNQFNVPNNYSDGQAYYAQNQGNQNGQFYDNRNKGYHKNRGAYKNKYHNRGGYNNNNNNNQGNMNQNNMSMPNQSNMIQNININQAPNNNPQSNFNQSNNRQFQNKHPNHNKYNYNRNPRYNNQKRGYQKQYQNPQFKVPMQSNPNNLNNQYQMMLMTQQMNNINFQQNKPKNYENTKIDHRNLQNLNKMQLQEQFNNKPPVDLKFSNPENEEDYEIEIADSIYEIVSKKYPDEASKITGMIKEMGYEKMNMLLSQKEDLMKMIEKAYSMLKSDE